MALTEFHLKKFAEARQSLMIAVGNNPHCQKCIALLGRIAFNQKQFVESEELLNSALALNPNDYKTRMQLAKCYFAQGQIEQSLQEFATAGKTEPDSGEPYAAVAAVFLLSGDWHSAIPNLTILRTRSPKDIVTGMIGYLVAQSEGNKEVSARYMQALRQQLPASQCTAEGFQQYLRRLLSTDDPSG